MTDRWTTVKWVFTASAAVLFVFFATAAWMERAKNAPTDLSTAAGIAYLPMLICTLVAGIMWRLGRPEPERGRCGHCGYDRCGIPRTAPCPECGTKDAQA